MVHLHTLRIDTLPRRITYRDSRSVRIMTTLSYAKYQRVSTPLLTCRFTMMSPSEYNIHKLSFGWWFPTAPSYSLQCNTSNYVTLTNKAFGQSNNVLLTLVHMLEYLVVRHPQPVLVMPKWFREVYNAFDLNTALNGWVCIAPTNGKFAISRTFDAASIYMLGQRELGEKFTRVVMTQILMRPHFHIYKYLQIRRSMYPNGYNAIHLRQLCREWYSNLHSCTNVYNGDELCSMQTSYLNRTLTRVEFSFGRLPLLIMHDANTKRELTNRIKRDFNAIVLNDADVYVDMLTMIHAKYFIGNPASTLSQNVMRVREEILSDSYARSNMHSCTRIAL